MSSLDLYTSARFVDGLGVVFYVGMAAALVSALMGSPGGAALLLVLGSIALVMRTALESLRGSAASGE